jgi:cyclic pyranopterin phosphate synthase
MLESTLPSPSRPDAASAPLPAPLADRFGRVHTALRISVTERCNLRCTYCMPPEGVALRPRAEILTFEEIERLARLFVRLGVDKIRLTGGEPTVRRGLPSLVARLAAIDGLRALAVTTNGLTLSEEAPGNADAAALRRAGLTHLNVSLDTLRPDRFERIALRPGLPAVLAGIDAALAAGFAPLKLNMVVMGGVNDDELGDFAELARDRPLHVRFIEYMPFDGNGWQRGELVPFHEMLARLGERFPLRPLSEIDNERADPAATAREFTIDGFAGRVGFITSMTHDFCGGCNRLRLLADGSIKSCLFFPPEDNLRLAMRRGATDADLESIIRRVVTGKRAGHAALDELAALPNNSMIEVGG